MVDYYLQDRTRLCGQPKKTIADYVESNGILVPKRFGSFDEAKTSGLPIIARSEHLQEYDGASGLLKSETLDKIPATDEEELRRIMLKEEENKVSFPRVYCSYFGLDLGKFLQEVSFSYWEKLSGANRMVIADSAIRGRHHVTTTNHSNLHNYVAVEYGKVVNDSGFPNLPDDFVNGLADLIETYEKIRNLGRFDSQHCPIMEFQTVDGLNYFLQYHRTRDFDPATFVLDRPKQNDEVEAYFARGKTPPEGVTVKAIVAYAGWNLGKSYEDWTVPEEDASFDMHYNHVFYEVMSRRRKVQFMTSTSVGLALAEIAVEHKSRSHSFKPEVSLIVHKDSLFSDDDYSTMYREIERTGEDQSINVHVVSDGRRALVKRV